MGVMWKTSENEMEVKIMTSLGLLNLKDFIRRIPGYEILNYNSRHELEKLEQEWLLIESCEYAFKRPHN